MVRKFTGISSVLLLLFYSVVFLHNALPHSHFEAPLQKGIEETHHHSDHHGHHHHHQHHVAEGESGNFLDDILGFLGGLDHEEPGNGDVELFLGEEAMPSLNLAKFLPLLAAPLVHSISLNAPAEDLVDHPAKPPNISSQHSLDTSPLRGPPSLS